jgi:hypothetical protein
MTPTDQDKAKAREISKSWFINTSGDTVVEKFDRDALTARIAAALAEQRERHALIAFPTSAEAVTGNGNAGNQYVVRRDIAAAIRAGGGA